MTTAITAPQVSVKHPDEEIWYEFSFAEIFKDDEEIWQNGVFSLACDPVGLTFDPDEVIVEDKSLFVYVSGGAPLLDPMGKLLSYNLTCGVDSTRDGMTKFAHRVQVARIRVSYT